MLCFGSFIWLLISGSCKLLRNRWNWRWWIYSSERFCQRIIVQMSIRDCGWHPISQKHWVTECFASCPRVNFHQWCLLESVPCLELAETVVLRGGDGIWYPAWRCLAAFLVIFFFILLYFFYYYFSMKRGAKKVATRPCPLHFLGVARNLKKVSPFFLMFWNDAVRKKKKCSNFGWL